jgi:hypothetical protein
MNDFLSFRKMITPLVIVIIFWLGVAVQVIVAFGMMFQGGAYILLGLIWLVIGPLLVRIYCELLILLFRIYDELVAIRTGVPPAGQGFPVIQSAAPVNPVPPAQSPM